MEAVGSALHGVGMAREQVVVERFQSLSTDPFEQVETVAVDAEAAGDVARLVVTLDGERHEIDWPRTSVLLDVLRGRGLEAPFSWREGACGACACKIKTGKVDMRRNEVLEAEDLDEGWSWAARPSRCPTRSRRPTTSESGASTEVDVDRVTRW